MNQVIVLLFGVDNYLIWRIYGIIWTDMNTNL